MRTSIPWVIARRIVTIPLYGLAFVVLVATLPLTLPVGAIIDVFGQKTALVRFLAFAHLHLACEFGGVIGSGAIRMLCLLPFEDRDRTKSRLCFALEYLWTRVVAGAGIWLYDLRLEVESTAIRPDRPVIVMSRHQTALDSLFPVYLLTHVHGLFVRHVYKRGLLLDPMVDLNGHAVPGYFVDRASGEPEKEMAAIGDLTRSLEAGEALSFYPEGTRFTPQKRISILRSLWKKGYHDLFRRAQELTHVLPPRHGGIQAILEANPGADVVFCSHHGFEGISTLWDFLRGNVLGRTIKIRFWRVPFEAIPRDGNARLDWIHRHWKAVDRFASIGTDSSVSRPPCDAADPNKLRKHACHMRERMSSGPCSMMSMQGEAAEPAPASSDADA